MISPLKWLPGNAMTTISIGPNMRNSSISGATESSITYVSDTI